jgi:flavin-dependent dehydrogenase
MGLRTDKIVIVGGGSAGWMTAATLVRAFPEKEIVVIESKDVPTVGVGESTLGGVREWTAYIGLDDKEFFPATDASYKLSIKFTDFYKKDDGSFHYPFGYPELQRGSNENPFFQWHFKKFFYPFTPVTDMVDCLIPSSALFNNNKISENKNKEFDSFNFKTEVAYHFDATKFGTWLRENYAKPRGVTHIQALVTKVNTDENGVSSLELDTGDTVTADLYVDCTGWRSILLGGALNEPFTSWEDILPNNSAVATHLSYKDKDRELEPFTNSTAIGHGWVWNIPLWSRIGTGYVYSDKYITFDEAVEEFKQHLMSDKMIVPRTREEVDALEFKDIKMRVGLHERTFVKNVVAIGLSAGFIEPLESNGLFSVHEFLHKLIHILSNREINQFYRDMYNNSVKDLFTGFAKFVANHYTLSQRDDTQYWRDLGNKTWVGHEGEPNSDLAGRNGGFRYLGTSYMDEWGFPLNNSGYPYITVGNHMLMISEFRAESMSVRHNTNYYELTKEWVDFWETRKKRWERAAKKAPLLSKYLADNFYEVENAPQD